jgi:hypothetical protein
MPVQSPYPYTVGAREDSRGHVSPYAAPPRRRPVLAYAFTAAMLLGAAVLIIGRTSLFDAGDSIGAASASDTPKTHAHTKGDKSKHPKPETRHSWPANTQRAAGPGWAMHVPSSWRPVDVPSGSHATVWTTPGGVAGVGDVVTVIHERPAASLDLEGYVDYSANLLSVGITTVTQVKARVFHAHAEIRYRSTINGNQARSLVYVVPSATGYASATFAAPAWTYADDVKRVERYLKTLTGR